MNKQSGLLGGDTRLYRPPRVHQGKSLIPIILRMKFLALAHAYESEIRCGFSDCFFKPNLKKLVYLGHQLVVNFFVSYLFQNDRKCVSILF